MHKKTIGAIAIIFAASLWAMDSAVLRPSLYNLDPVLVVFLEHAIAFTLMAGFLFYERKELKKLSIKDWGAFGWVSLFGGAIGTLAITKAFFSVFLDGISSVSVVVLLQKIQPIFAIILAWALLRERPKPQFFGWAALALVGSYLTAFGFSLPDLTSQNPALTVPLLAILAAFCFGSSTVFGKSAVKKVNFRVATYIRFGMTTLIMFFVMIFFSRFSGLRDFTPANFITLFIIIFSSGALAIFIYYYGLKRVLASKATIYELAFPVIALALDFFLHDTILSTGQWFGAIVLVGAIIMVQRT